MLNMYVSPVLAEGLLLAYPQFANSPLEARNLLKAQYPNRDDISDEELLLTMEEVLAQQASTPGKLPGTLLIFDELQQFIGEDAMRTLQVQTLVEACSARFGSKLLFVATGQAALQANTQLSKLQGRFTVRVTLSDTDVEQVVRAVVLRKQEAKKPLLKRMLETASGEIDRQLAGTKIGPRPSDNAELVLDYPLLPVRRRFWERVLRAIDSAGTAGQLRTQLKIVHEAVRVVADQPLGTVVAADLMFEQLRQHLLQTGVLLRDQDTMIASQRLESKEGELRARICALLFLISKLPNEGPLVTGIQATAQTLADLLTDDLVAGSAMLRQRLPAILNDLVEAGAIMQVGEEYRLQTRESSEWEADFRSRFARIQADESRLASDRTDALRISLTEALRGLTFTQGVTKTPRKYDLLVAGQQPTTNSESVPVLVRDEWSVAERNVRDEAQVAGVESPAIFVFLPKRQPDALQRALAAQAAAKETLDTRPRSITSEGIEARSAMEARLRQENNTVKLLVGETIQVARLLQGGGNEISENSLPAGLRVAVEAALVRLFPEFSLSDQTGWSTVVTRASQGAVDALTAVGYPGDADKHPVCKQLREWIGGSAKRGLEIRKHFLGSPYGWPQDAIDGALLALVAGGFVRASRNGQAVGVKELVRAQIGVHDFVSEGFTVTTGQRLQLRKLLQNLAVPFKPGEEAAAIPALLQQLRDLAQEAGGLPPLPIPPTVTTLEHLQSYSGNQLVIETVNRAGELEASFTTWGKAKKQIVQRQPRWQLLQRLLHQATSLPEAAAVAAEVAAINSQRALLSDPDPTTPLINTLTTALRRAVQDARQQLADLHASELARLHQSNEWQRTAAADQQQLLARNWLGPIPPLKVGAEEELLAELERRPLTTWASELAALPGRIATTRAQAAQRLQPAAVSLSVPHATLHTAAEVESYLEQLRALLLQHVEQGRPVIL